MSQYVQIRKAESNATVTFSVDDLLTLNYDITMNQGGTASCSVTFGYDNADRVPTGPSFRWSDGTRRGIRLGDYFFIYDNNKRVFYGRVSLVLPENHTLRLEAIDTVYQLKGIGHTYVRDHYAAFSMVLRPLGKDTNGRITIGIPKDIEIISRMAVFGKEGGNRSELTSDAYFDFRQYIVPNTSNLPYFRSYQQRYVIKTKFTSFNADAGATGVKLRIKRDKPTSPLFPPTMTARVSIWNENGTLLGYGDGNYGSKYWQGERGVWEISSFGPGGVGSTYMPLSMPLKGDQIIYITVDTRETQDVDDGVSRNQYNLLAGDYADLDPSENGIRSTSRYVDFSITTSPDIWSGWSPSYDELASSEMYRNRGDIFPNITYEVSPPYVNLLEVSQYTNSGMITIDPYDNKEVRVFYIDSVAGLSTLDENTLFLWSRQGDILGGIVYGYIGDRSKMEIASDILNANKIAFTPNTSAMTKRFSFVRCSGAPLSDYMEMLVNAVNDNGRNNTMSTNLSTGAILFGNRNSLYYDNPTKYLRIGTEPIIDFSPQKNLSYKKVTNVIKGADPTNTDVGKNEKYPLMICMTDVASLKEQGYLNNSKLGNSSGSTVADMVTGLYSDLAANVSKDWTASVTLSGIDYSYLEMSEVASDVGSGKVVSVTNPVMGITDYKMIVQSVSFDYVNHTTTLVLNSYPIEYVNRITDTENMVLVSVNTSFDISGDNEILQQHYRILENVTKPSAINNVKITIETSSGSDLSYNASRIYVHDLPNLRSMLVTSVFRPELNPIKDHGVKRVSVTTNITILEYEIPEVERPDWFNYQTLIINTLLYYGT